MIEKSTRGSEHSEEASAPRSVKTANTGGANFANTGKFHGPLNIINAPDAKHVVLFFLHPGPAATAGRELWHEVMERLPRGWLRWLGSTLAALVMTALVLLYAAAMLFAGLVFPFILAREMEDKPRKAVTIGYTIVLGILLIALGDAALSGAGSAASRTDTSKMCTYSWSLESTSELPARVPVAEASREYRLIVHTNRGDITLQSMAKRYPCAAFALRVLADHNFYDHQACPRLETPANVGYLLYCYDTSSKYPANGVRFAPDDQTEDESTAEGIVMLSQPAPDQAAGLLVFGGNGLSPAQTYRRIPCARVVGGLEILRKVVDAGDTGSWWEAGGNPKRPITINYMEPATSS